MRLPTLIAGQFIARSFHLVFRRCPPSSPELAFDGPKTVRLKIWAATNLSAQRPLEGTLVRR